VDLIRWKQDLIEDRNRLAALAAAARQVDAARDAKLTALRAMIGAEMQEPDQPRQPKGARLHRLCRHCSLSL